MRFLTRILAGFRRFRRRVQSVSIAGIKIDVAAPREPLASSLSRWPVAARLLLFIWRYPFSGEKQASWAAKESAVLKGELGVAQDQPGLGVAIVTTELASIVFGDQADSRIERCISWGVACAERQPPHRILAERRDPITFEILEVKPDLRHTLSFAVVLARARRHYSYLVSYLDLALELQRDDGGWPADSVATVSEVFTALYAVELLHLAESDQLVSQTVRDAIPNARERGIDWLMENRRPDGLWSTGVLTDFTWDPAIASAWILHRLSQTSQLSIHGWRGCLDQALSAMIQQALDPQTWVGSSAAQRHRVEARIVAAAARAQSIAGLSARSRDATRLYVASWTDRAEHWVSRLPPVEMDVGTAAFLVEGMAPIEQLRKFGRLVLASEASTRSTNSNAGSQADFH